MFPFTRSTFREETKKMNRSFLILFVLGCCFGGSLCLKEETIDKALIRAQNYLETIQLHPEMDNDHAILSSELAVDFGGMDIVDFFSFESYEKIMIAAVHSVLRKLDHASYDQLIAKLNRVVLMKKPKNNGFSKVDDFKVPGKFWKHKKSGVNPRKLERLTKWFYSLLDDKSILGTTKFMNSQNLHLFEMGKAVIPYLEKACLKNPLRPPRHNIINLTILKYPSLYDLQIKVYNIEISLSEICSTGEFVLHGKFQSHSYTAWKTAIEKMTPAFRKKVAIALETWIEFESIKSLFDDTYFIVKKWYNEAFYRLT